jgi:hypothetical protein
MQDHVLSWAWTAVAVTCMEAFQKKPAAASRGYLHPKKYSLGPDNGVCSKCFATWPNVTRHQTAAAPVGLL